MSSWCSSRASPSTRRSTFFPTAGAFAAFADELSAYKTSKSAIRFPLDEPLPVDLIDAIVRFRVNEVADYVASKKR